MKMVGVLFEYLLIKIPGMEEGENIRIKIQTGHHTAYIILPMRSWLPFYSFRRPLIIIFACPQAGISPVMVQCLTGQI